MAAGGSATCEEAGGRARAALARAAHPFASGADPPTSAARCTRRRSANAHKTPAAAAARCAQGTVGELKARACALFKVHEGDVRIWDFFQHSK